MAAFSSDADLLKWEPVLFREFLSASQVLCQGTDGETNGTAFTSSGASFLTRGVRAGHVITLWNEERTMDGSYEIVSADSETSLTISALRKAGGDAAIAVPERNGLRWRIGSFDPQAEEIGYGLLQYFGLDVSEDGGEQILDERALRLCSVYGVLSAVFASQAGGEEDVSGCWQKSLRYQKLFETARNRAKVRIDVNQDRRTDEVRAGGAVRLSRG